MCTACGSPLRIEIIVSLFIHQVSCYWISDHEMTWDDAESYCNDACNSNLASIHSQTDFDHIIAILNSKNLPVHSKVWFGLYDIYYTDGSPSDFVTNNNISFWDDNNNQLSINDNNTDCFNFILDIDSDNVWKWNNDECHHLHTFICNNCIPSQNTTNQPIYTHTSIISPTNTPTTTKNHKIVTVFNTLIVEKPTAALPENFMVIAIVLGVLFCCIILLISAGAIYYCVHRRYPINSRDQRLKTLPKIKPHQVPQYSNTSDIDSVQSPISLKTNSTHSSDSQQVSQMNMKQVHIEYDGHHIQNDVKPAAVVHITHIEGYPIMGMGGYPYPFMAPIDETEDGVDEDDQKQLYAVDTLEYRYNIRNKGMVSDTENTNSDAIYDNPDAQTGEDSHTVAIYSVNMSMAMNVDVMDIIPEDIDDEDDEMESVNDNENGIETEAGMETDAGVDHEQSVDREDSGVNIGDLVSDVDNMVPSHGHHYKTTTTNMSSLDIEETGDV